MDAKDEALFRKYKQMMNRVNKKFFTLVKDSDLRKIKTDSEFNQLIDNYTFFNFCARCHLELLPSINRCTNCSV